MIVVVPYKKLMTPSITTTVLYKPFSKILFFVAHLVSAKLSFYKYSTLQLEDVCTQTIEDEDDDNELISHDLGELRMRRKKKSSRRVSVAMTVEDGIRKAARRVSIVEASHRRGSMTRKGNQFKNKKIRLLNLMIE